MWDTCELSQLRAAQTQQHPELRSPAEKTTEKEVRENRTVEELEQLRLADDWNFVNLKQCESFKTDKEIAG